MKNAANTTLATDQYWATVSSADLGAEMCARIRAYYQYLDQSGRLSLYRRATRIWYGLDAEGGWKSSSAVTYGGQQGEIVGARANHARALGQQTLSLIVGKRLAAAARAGNDSPEAIEEAILCDALISHDREKTQIEEAFTRAVERAIRFGEGWVYQYWDEWAGEHAGVEMDPVSGSERVRYTGDVRSVPKTPLEVIRDPDAEIEGDAEPEWLIIRCRVNKWEALARWGMESEQAANAIREAPSVYADDASKYDGMGAGQSTAATRPTDAIHVFEFYHRATTAMPVGRYAMMVGQTVIRDGAMPYAHMPAIPMIPDVEEGTPFGYATFWDLLALQALYDSALSTMATNHDAGGLTKLWTATGDAVDEQTLSTGLVVLHCAVKPEALDLTGSSEQTEKLRDMVKNDMELISGINSTQRGEPDENLRSGAALALIQARAVEFMTKSNAAYARMIERTLSARVGIWQRYVEAERVYEIAGPRAGMWATQTWNKDAIKNITRVVIELADPVSQTAQGRKLLADEWVKYGWITSPEQYAMVLTTGRAESFVARPRDVMRMIAQENEALRNARVKFNLDGTPTPESLAMLPQVAMTDAHSVHIREHACLLDDPRVRFDPQRVTVVNEHILGHTKMAKITDPMILTAVGEPIPPDHIIATGQAPGGMPGSAPAPNDGGKAPATSGPSASEDENPQIPAPPGSPPDVAKNQPRMPKNPATGQHAPMPQ